MAGPWWETYPVTVPFHANEGGFGIEQGTDYGTPLDTSLTAPFGGTVIGANYFPWGGEVDVAVSIPGHPEVKTETFLHLDQILVAAGQRITPGQSIGLSGGQLSGGSHPTQASYSTGPHTELDFFAGTPFASASYDPRGILTGANPANPVSDFASQLGALLGTVSGQAIQTASTGFGIAAAGQEIGQGIASVPTTIGHGLADALTAGATDIGVFFRRQAIALFVAALVLFVLFAR